MGEWQTVDEGRALRNFDITASGSLAIMGDALGVVHDAQKFRAKDAVLNSIMAELALIIAPMGHDLRAVRKDQSWKGLDIRATHIWSERNDVCDQLSRLAPGVPPVRRELKGAVRAKRQPVPKFLLEPQIDETNLPQNIT